MTCIAAVIGSDGVYMGGDSAGVTESFSLSVRRDAKVFHSGPYLLGFTSSFRMGQILQYIVKLPDPPKEPAALFGFMVKDFGAAIREAFKGHGFASKYNEQEYGGTFLVGIGRRLFEIGGDYQVAENVAPFAAVGCGEHLALGALTATEGMRLTPRERVLGALKASERWSAGVRGPFRVLRTRKP